MSSTTESLESLIKDASEAGKQITGSELIVVVGYLLVQNELLGKKQRSQAAQLKHLGFNLGLLTLGLAVVAIAGFLK